LWFAEEREHSRLLAGAVRRVCGTFITSTPAFRLFNGQWTIVSAPAAPQGGGTIDVEARAALAILFTRLSQAGIFPGS